MATKQQKLRATAEGFMGGLVACGFLGPWQFSHLDWELPFYRAWNTWPPAQQTPEAFPTFSVAGHPASEGRDMLWQLKKTSAFHDYARAPLPTQPRGLDIREYLDIYADTASADAWITLAGSFLIELEKAQASRS